MKPIQLHHTSIRVADVERSRQFYEGLLGLAAVERPDLGMPGGWYGLGAGQLHLIQCDPLGMAIRSCRLVGDAPKDDAGTKPATSSNIKILSLFIAFT